MDKILLNDLEVRYRVGVPDAERREPQRLLLTVEMRRDFTAAARADDLRETIDYHQVALRLLAFGEGREWRLIETLAVEIAETLLREFRPESVTVRIDKFILPQTRSVAVEATRPRPNPEDEDGGIVQLDDPP